MCDPRQRDVERCEAWLREGVSRLVWIEGGAGLGKTTVVDEVVRRETARGQTVWRACADRGSSVGLGRVRSLLESRPDGPAESLGVALNGAEHALATGSPELETWLDRLAAELTAQTRSPLLLALEDLDGADPATLRWLDALVPMLGACRAPLRVLVTLRPPADDSELAHVLPSWRRLESTRGARLRPLTSSEVRAWVHRLCGIEASEPLLDLLAEARGNPLLLRARVRELQSSGRVEERSGVLWTDVRADELGLPDALGPWLRDLLEPLSEDARSLLGVAACLGDEFSTTRLAGLAERPSELLLHQLDQLERARILDGSGDRYAFAQPLLRLGVCRDLAPTERARIETRIAGTLA